MNYDVELQRARWVIWIALLVNLAMGVYHAYMGNGALAVAFGIWTLSCRVWLLSVHAQQMTRDLGRVIEAGLRGMREEIQRGDR